VKNIIFIIYTALFLAACGGSSSSTTNTPNNSDNSESVSKIGVFIDAPVKGLVYVSTLSNIKILRNSILYFVDITDVTYQYSIALNKDMHGQLLVCWGKSKSELVHPYGCMHGGQLKYLYKTVESAKEALENQ
jgi:uncharacterized lipoprotein YajG